MLPEIQKNIAYVLKSLKKILHSSHIASADLKKLSNSLMEDVSLFRDKDSLSLEIFVYSLYKIINKDTSVINSSLIKHIDLLIKSVYSESIFRQQLRRAFEHLKAYDKNIDVNILQIIRHAEVKKGLKIYEHGLSISEASEILGVSRWELMEYLGTAGIIDKDIPNLSNYKHRLNFARGLFQ